DSIRIQVKGDFDLRHAAGRRRNICQLELANRLVVARELAFSLEHMDFHARLIVRRSRKDFGLAGWNRGVALDELCKYAAEGLDSEGQRCNIEQEHVFDFALEDTALNSGADCNH